MQTIKINLHNLIQEQISLIADYLKRGLVIAYPTDTIYGLGCDPKNVKAIKKINKIKGEKGDKPLLVLISDFVMLKQYCFINFEQLKYLKKIWPGPVTVILKRRPNLPPELTGGLNSLAVRLPDNEFLTKIINEAGWPLVSTSLNKKGEKPLTNVQNIESHFKYKPDLAVDAGECEKTKPSRLVDLRDIENIKILRK
jgi:L-threonylcarbamoyladenylate synthase